MLRNSNSAMRSLCWGFRMISWVILTVLICAQEKVYINRVRRIRIKGMSGLGINSKGFMSSKN